MSFHELKSNSCLLLQETQVQTVTAMPIEYTKRNHTIKDAIGSSRSREVIGLHQRRFQERLLGFGVNARLEMELPNTNTGSSTLPFESPSDWGASNVSSQTPPMENLPAPMLPRRTSSRRIRPSPVQDLNSVRRYSSLFI